MKMTISLSGFPMNLLQDYIKEVNKYTKCTIQVGGEDTIFVTCEASMTECQQVVIISDLYQEGGRK